MPYPSIKGILVKSLFATIPLAMSNSLAQTAPPPGLDEETKGTPAIEETTSVTAPSEEAAPEPAEQTTQSSGLLGTAKITESRRESGQVYRIELEHSSGSKQIIEETDSDGNIESTNNDIEETPNLPKWRLGSW